MQWQLSPIWKQLGFMRFIGRKTGRLATLPVTWCSCVLLVIRKIPTQISSLHVKELLMCMAMGCRLCLVKATVSCQIQWREFVNVSH